MVATPEKPLAVMLGQTQNESGWRTLTPTEAATRLREVFPERSYMETRQKTERIFSTKSMQEHDVTLQLRGKFQLFVISSTRYVRLVFKTGQIVQLFTLSLSCGGEFQ